MEMKIVQYSTDNHVLFTSYMSEHIMKSYLRKYTNISDFSNKVEWYLKQPSTLIYGIFSKDKIVGYFGLYVDEIVTEFGFTLPALRDIALFIQKEYRNTSILKDITLLAEKTAIEANISACQLSVITNYRIKSFVRTYRIYGHDDIRDIFHIYSTSDLRKKGTHGYSTNFSYYNVPSKYIKFHVNDGDINIVCGNICINQMSYSDGNLIEINIFDYSPRMSVHALLSLCSEYLNNNPIYGKVYDEYALSIRDIFVSVSGRKLENTESEFTNSFPVIGFHATKIYAHSQVTPINSIIH